MATYRHNFLLSSFISFGTSSQSVTQDSSKSCATKIAGSSAHRLDGDAKGSSNYDPAVVVIHEEERAELLLTQEGTKRAQ